MSTIATTAPATVERPTGKGLSFARLLQVELRKQVDTRGGRGLLIAIAMITALVLAVMMYVNRDGGVGFGSLVMATSTPQGMLIPVLGIIAACNEWSQRTALITFTQEPRRWRGVAAKTLAAIIWATAFLLLAWGLAALTHVVLAQINNTPVDFDMTGKQYLAGWVDQMVGVVMGLGFGFLLLITPLAIAAYYVAPSLVSGLTMAIPALRGHGGWVNTLSAPIAQQPLMEGMPVQDNVWAKFATSMLLWVVIPFAVGTMRVLRREVK